MTSYLPTNLVQFCFDNSQHDRQAGALWFFHNTVLWEADRDNFSEVRLFDCGSDFGDGGYYGLNPSLKNVGDKLHYLTRNNGNVCQQPEDGCTDWGPMQQTVQEEFGRMRAFNNALIRKSFTPEAEFSETQLTRYLWDQLELVGANFITEGWDVDLVPDDGSGGGYGQRPLPATHVFVLQPHRITYACSIDGDIDAACPFIGSLQQLRHLPCRRCSRASNDQTTTAPTTCSQCAGKCKSCDVPCVLLPDLLFLMLRMTRWRLSGRQAVARPSVGGLPPAGAPSGRQCTARRRMLRATPTLGRHRTRGCDQTLPHRPACSAGSADSLRQDAQPLQLFLQRL